MLLFACPAPTVSHADEVDAYVTHFIQAKQIPGLSLSVVRDGKLVKAAGYGLANLELNSAATPETVYEIGSITKQFTAEAVLLLVEEGRLGLDDRLGKHLSGLPPAWQGLTLRQMLSHTSGLKDWESANLLSFRREYTPAEYIELMSAYPLDFPPGEGWSYSNTTYPLLGLVVTQASGKPFDEFVAGRIFKPLGMGATRFSRPQDVVMQRAGGYVEETGRWRKGELLRPRVLEPNGGILSTVLDLAKWEQVLSRETLLKRSSLEAMQTPVRLPGGQSIPAGFGVFLDNFRGHRLLVHNGSTPGGFSSVFYHYPDDKLTVILLCNIDRGAAINHLATRVASFYVPGLDITALPERPDPDPATSAQLLAMLRELAERRVPDLLLPGYGRRIGEATRTRVAEQFAGLTRFVFLDREDQPKSAVGPAMAGARILRYRMVSAKRPGYYTFHLTADGKIAEMSFEDD